MQEFCEKYPGRSTAQQTKAPPNGLTGVVMTKRIGLIGGALVALGMSLCGGAAFAAFQPTQSPVSPFGVAATVDLPASQHMKNVGGSDGAGLCVFTSTQHACRWHNLGYMEGFRAWMERRPGGGWPEKLDQMIGQFCREKGVPIPLYVQHTGGDEAFLDLAIHTDRMPCVTYDGRDDFYRGRIAHMVNLAHIDANAAAIIDNNRPGSWVWMSRAEFLSRWRGNDGGWAVVFLDPPPPPHPGAGQVFEQCAGGQCPAPTVRPAGPEPIGQPPSDRHEWGEIPGYGWGWRFKRDHQPVQAPAVGDATQANYGLDTKRIHNHPEWSISGVKVTRPEALAAISGGSPLADDSDRWHLTAVGDAAFLARFKLDVAALPADVRGKLLVQGYGPDHWAVALFALQPGVNLRKPSPGRRSADVGQVAPADYTAAKLLALLSLPGGPVQTPAPQPQPSKPDPVPAPGPEPAPAPAPDNSPLWLVALAAILYFVFRKRGAESTR